MSQPATHNNERVDAVSIASFVVIVSIAICVAAVVLSVAWRLCHWIAG